MKIEYFKKYDDSNNEEMLQNIADKTRDWNAKKIDDAAYHSQVALLYSVIYRPGDCKKHADLVPDWAAADIKSGALVSVARMLIFEKNTAAALEYYTRAYTLDAENDVAIEEAGWCCFELKQYAAAEDWFKKAVALEDDFVTFQEGLGRSLALQEKYTEAIPAFEKALAYELSRNGENYAEVYYDLIGQCYAALDDFYRALGYYTKSLEAEPTYPSALNDIASLYFNQEGEVSIAIDFLKKAEAAAEENNNAHILQTVYLNLAQLYKKIKEFDLHEYYQQKFVGAIFGFDVRFTDEDEAEVEEADIDYDEIERIEAEKERIEQEENEHTAGPGTVKFIISRTGSGTCQYSLLDGSEKIIMTSSEYSSKEACEEGIADIRSHCNFFGFMQTSNKKGQPYFAFTKDSHIIAKSRFYKKWQQRNAAFNFVQQHIKDAGVEDRTK